MNVTAVMMKNAREAAREPQECECPRCGCRNLKRLFRLEGDIKGWMCGKCGKVEIYEVD